MKTRIRIIVDEGKINCPLCKSEIDAGWGHKCNVDTEAKTTEGVDFKLSQENLS